MGKTIDRHTYSPFFVDVSGANNYNEVWYYQKPNKLNIYVASEFVRAVGGTSWGLHFNIPLRGIVNRDRARRAKRSNHAK